MKRAQAIAFLIPVLVLVAGCTTTTPPGVPQIFPPGQSTTVPTLAVEPTQTLPPGQDVSIQVNQKDTSYATITVIFAGGEGQVAVRDVEVRVTRPDGTTETAHIKPLKGSEAKLQGTRGTDRVEAWVTLNTGNRYKTVDVLVPFRNRG